MLHNHVQEHIDLIAKHEQEFLARRSPAETRRAARERARRGRTESWAITKANSVASTRPIPRRMKPELRRSVTPLSAWLAGSLTRIAHWTSEAWAYPVMVSVPLTVRREEPERPAPENAAVIAALSTWVRRAPRASICAEVISPQRLSPWGSNFPSRVFT